MMDAKKHARPPPTHPRRGATVVWLAGLLVALFFFTVPLFLAASRARPDLWQMGIRATARHGSVTSASPAERDVLLGGLLSPDITSSSCESRYRSPLHRKASSHSPSPYLASRLRKYEALHRKCGPGTLFYKKSLMQLTSANSMGLAACSYLVWTPYNHLGDRMLSMASAFLYALLTHRVFLVHLTADMADLFCEPFPGSSWKLPEGFLIENLTLLHRGTEQSYGNLVGTKKVVISTATVRGESLPAYAYIHLQHDYQQLDQLFFCDDDQTVLGKVNWLVLSSDLYFAPGLFLVPQFEDELRWMFPARDTVFHHLGRYLFHPSNTTWKLITRYYKSYMASFKEKIGVQITTFPWSPVSSSEYFKQVLSCTSQEKILPELVVVDDDPNAAVATASKAVLVSADQPEYAEKMKSMFYEHATVTGETISVLQTPAGKKQQQQQSHNQKVLAEILLQSYCDVAVVSGWSTVGYIGHSLAGVKPWLLLTPRNRTAATDPPCVRTKSMEPCFHAPPRYDCRAKKNGDLGAVLRHVRHCEDAGDGIKLYD